MKLLMLDIWNHLTMCKQISSGSFKNDCLQTIHLLILKGKVEQSRERSSALHYTSV